MKPRYRISKRTGLIVLALFMPMILIACQKETKPDSSELKEIREELEKSNRRLEDMQRNQRIEREGKALENQKSYFQ
jgi:hypothetical protein